MDRKLFASLLKGLITYMPGFSFYDRNLKSKSYHSYSNPRFCYSLWLRSLTFLSKYNLPTYFNHFGEIGIGGSLGVGICSLLTGCKNYYALELSHDIDIDQNIKLLDEVFELFNKRSPIPDDKEFPQINFNLKNYDFPSGIITEDLFTSYINNRRYNEIKESILQLENYSNERSGLINIILNWEEKIHDFTEQFDFIFSRAVMEHLKDPDAVYNKLGNLIKVGGLTLHDIELHSHGLTKNWNGHYFINDLVWKIIYGKRKYFLNRHTASFHKVALQKNNFEIVECVRRTKRTIDHNKLYLNNSNYSTYGIFLLGRKLLN